MAVRSLCLATLLAGCAAYPSRLSTFFATPRPARPHNALQPPNIGIEYATNFTMRADGTSSGMLYASQDYTLFAQTKPAALYPYQLNLGARLGDAGLWDAHDCTLFGL